MIIQTLALKPDNFPIELIEDLKMDEEIEPRKYLAELCQKAKFLSTWNSSQSKLISYIAYMEINGHLEIVSIWTNSEFESSDHLPTLLTKLTELNYSEIRVKVRSNYFIENILRQNGFNIIIKNLQNDSKLMRKIRSTAVMQPYFFPSMRYFNLIMASNNFVFLDDVNFIKKSFINRNKIKNLESGSMNFVIPLKSKSQNIKINQTKVYDDPKWKQKIRLQLLHAYSRAPYFIEITSIVENVLALNSIHVSDFAKQSIIEILKYLELDKVTFSSFKDFHNTQELEKSERLIQICKQLGSNYLVNSIGGRFLYDPIFFRQSGIDLRFVNSTEDFGEKQELSIIDDLMYLDKNRIKENMLNYNLI